MTMFSSKADEYVLPVVLGAAVATAIWGSALYVEHRNCLSLPFNTASKAALESGQVTREELEQAMIEAGDALVARKTTPQP